MSREPGEAPGLEWKRRPKDGDRIPRWRARKKAVALGYRPSVIQLDMDPSDHAALSERCRSEWTKMEAWLANERPAPVFDGTLASLIDLYWGDAESPYHELRYRSQRTLFPSTARPAMRGTFRITAAHHLPRSGLVQRPLLSERD
jgi:hypothetical protein